MRLNISAWSIRTPIPSVVMFIVLIILGILSFRALPIERFPNIDIPLVSIAITQAGASPSELENQVTRRVENAVSALTGVKHVTSAITDGSSVTTIEFVLGTNTDRALNDAKDAIARIRAELPRTIDEPISQRIDVAGLPILTYAASAHGMDIKELSWFIDDTLARELQTVRGVAEVRRVGGVDREIRVSLDPDRLLALGITAGDVSNQLRATNVDVAGGKSEIGGSEQTIRALASADTVERLGSTTVKLPGGRKVRLDELGTVRDSFEEPKFFARFNGEEVVGFNISRSKGESDVGVAERVDAKIAELLKRYQGVELRKVDSTVTYTEGNYDSTMHTLLEGALLAVLVVLIFLRDLRATVIAAVALPLSIMPTFWAMEAMGFSLNLVTLLALTLVTGILVDDAIVEIENIVRHMRMGKSPYRAALEAADEIGLAVIAITFTIVAVFIPVSFMSGIAGQYFRQFGITVAAAVLFSLLVARLITPMMAAYFMRDHGEPEAKDGWLLRQYTRLIGWSVRHRLATVALGFLIFLGSIFSMMLLPQGFVPAEDAARILIAAELPPGSRLQDMKAESDRITKLIRERPEVQDVFVDGGRILGFAGGGQEVRKATFTINLVNKDDRELDQRTLEQIFTDELSKLPDVRAWVINENGQRALSLIVSGSDGPAVAETAPRIVSAMRRVPELSNVVSNSALDRPEVRFRPRPEVAAELGVSTEALSEVIRIATIGDIDANLAKFNAGDRQIPIRVQLDEDARSNSQILESLKIRTGAGAAVPLVSVASIESGQGPSSIDRYDRQRRVVIGADLVGTDALGAALEKVYQLPEVKALENNPGVQLKQTGDAEIMGEVFSSFGYAIGAGIMMVYSVLILLFGSFLQPITILFSLPLSIGGAIFALLLTDRPFSFPVVIGILMLMGIVTKNAIMLVDFAIEEIARGVKRYDAIVDAGRKRARPIVMTTIAMAGGMLPSALALGAGGEFRSPMAIAVIGGLLLSTLLSLIFVPAVFILMDDIGSLIWRLFGRFVGPVDEPGAEPLRIEAKPAGEQAALARPRAAE
ncbi:MULTISPECIES: efflux RND transporter permease subunit [Rhodomicrobium]|uniref:efflux RND transporter permease subunit n=1 Tax=Rhodomicrobium TaxID=1068 RepID=UPI000B4A81E9|nr:MULTISPECIES: efflux RND transporter permease subunit [Rhodomicrobium]